MASPGFQPGLGGVRPLRPVAIGEVSLPFEGEVQFIRRRLLYPRECIDVGGALRAALRNGRMGDEIPFPIAAGKHPISKGDSLPEGAPAMPGLPMTGVVAAIALVALEISPAPLLDGLEDARDLGSLRALNVTDIGGDSEPRQDANDGDDNHQF